jgi:hypothetical protein
MYPFQLEEMNGDHQGTGSFPVPFSFHLCNLTIRIWLTMINQFRGNIHREKPAAKHSMGAGRH